MSKKIAFCSLMAALGIISLAITYVLPANKIFMYLLSTMFTYICVEEYGIKYGFMTFAVILAGGFLIAANKVGMIGYAIMVGYYPIVKHFIEHLSIKTNLKRGLKLLFSVFVLTVAFFVLKSLLTFDFPIYIVFIIGILIFIVYDIVLTMGIKFYALKLRKLK
ncbi:MAG: hypothetical protein IJQ28_07265 [Clostridia bacterium]|nr:hypothetical protein [Clostridia bacterium]